MLVLEVFFSVSGKKRKEYVNARYIITEERSKLTIWLERFSTFIYK